MANQTARVNVRLKSFHDGLTNVVSSIGTAKDKTTWNQYSYRPLSRHELEAIYYEDWIGRKAVDLIPDDMTREWRSWTTEDAETIYEEEKRLDVRAKVALALKWERLYGGAAILIGTGDANPEEPLDLDRLGRGGLKYLHVFSRHELQADPEWERDLASPDYGKPRWFTPILTGSTVTIGVKIHRSRFIIFDGLDVPRSWREANDGWGMPVFQHLRQAIINAAATNANVAALIEEAKLDVIKVPDLDARLSDPESERRVIHRFALASQLKSTINTLLLGTGEEFDRKQTAFAGLTDVMKAQLQVVSGALDMPVTRFLGQSPQGMAASGDVELRTYYDMIRSKQSTDLAGVLAPLDEAVVRSATGAYPTGTAYEWSELWTPTPEERSKIEKAEAETDKIYSDLGIFPTEGFAKAVRDRLIERGTYPSLDQHVREEDLSGIDEADPEDVVIDDPAGDDGTDV